MMYRYIFIKLNNAKQFRYDLNKGFLCSEICKVMDVHCIVVITLQNIQSSNKYNDIY